MATGDQNDVTGRLQALLPARWFVGSTPVLNAVLAGIAALLSQIYSLYAYAKQQSRILTSSGAFLDLVAGDYFGSGLPRMASETDAAYLARIQANLFVKRVTRPAMSAALTTLTGNPPTIFEPMNPADTGCFSTPASNGYFGVARAGSMALPFTAFITVYRTAPAAASLGGTAFANSPAWSAWSKPQSNDYAGSMVGSAPQISTAAIYATVAANQPAATTVWVGIKQWINQTPLTLTDGNANTVQASIGGTLETVVVPPLTNRPT